LIYDYLHVIINPRRNVIERDFKENSKRRFDCRTQSSKSKEKFTEKIAPYGAFII
jgi:hypothetical protein